MADEKKPQSEAPPFEQGPAEAQSENPGQDFGSSVGYASTLPQTFEPQVTQGPIHGAVNPNMVVGPETFLGDGLRPITAEYVPQAVLGMYGYVGLLNRNRPPFTYWTIRDMLCDPRITFGLMLLKGPLVSNPTFEVKCEDASVAEFLESNLTRFWNVAVMRVLKALEWGYSASEILYRQDPSTNLIHFDDVRDLESLDCRPVILDGSIIGFRYRKNPDPWGMTASANPVTASSTANPVPQDKDRNKIWDGWGYIGAPRALWHVHWRDRNPWFGLSRLFGTHVPWWEMWSEDGYRNIRRLWYTGCAFDGGIMYHPNGTVQTPSGPILARDYARQLVNQKRTGATLTLPNQLSADGSTQAWLYQPPEGNPTPAGLLEYGEDLRAEIFESLGIPPEVIQSSGETGFGSSSGRQVPQMAYHAILHQIASDLVKDFDRQSLRYLVACNFGSIPYEIAAVPIDSAEAAPTDPNNPAMEALAGEDGNEEEPGDESNDRPPQ